MLGGSKRAVTTPVLSSNSYSCAARSTRARWRMRILFPLQKNVSLAYQEGLYPGDGDGHARLRSATISAGPDLFVGTVSIRASNWSELSKQLSPPVKWSHRRIVGLPALIFFCLAWLLNERQYAERNCSFICQHCGSISSAQKSLAR
jgi:hypothetical protein